MASKEAAIISDEFVPCYPLLKLLWKLLLVSLLDIR